MRTFPIVGANLGGFQTVGANLVFALARFQGAIVGFLWTKWTQWTQWTEWTLNVLPLFLFFVFLRAFVPSCRSHPPSRLLST